VTAAEKEENSMLNELMEEVNIYIDEVMSNYDGPLSKLSTYDPIANLPVAYVNAIKSYSKLMQYEFNYDVETPAIRALFGTDTDLQSIKDNTEAHRRFVLFIGANVSIYFMELVPKYDIDAIHTPTAEDLVKQFEL